jgi:hypothetical protein
VVSVLPHSLGQGQRLEGLVVQAYRTTPDVLIGLHSQSALLLPYQGALVAALTAFGARMAGVGPQGFPSFAPPDRTMLVPAQDLSVSLTASHSTAPVLAKFLSTHLTALCSTATVARSNIRL